MFKKKKYSDLEVEEILQTLFIEKKKSHELELKLKNCSLAPVAPLSQDLETLQNNYHQIKKEYRELLEERAKDQLALQKLQSLQLDDSSKWQKENEHLKQKHQEALEIINHYKQTIQLFKDQEELQKAHFQQNFEQKKEQLSFELAESKQREIKTKEALHHAEMEIEALQHKLFAITEENKLKNSNGSLLDEKIKELFETKENEQRIQENLKHAHEEIKSLKEQLLLMQEHRSKQLQLNQQSDLLVQELNESKNKEIELQENLLQAEEEISLLKLQLVNIKEHLQKNPPQDLEQQKQKEQQLQRAIQFMRKRADEEHAENNELLRRIALADEAYQKLHNELIQAKEVQKQLTENLNLELEIKEDYKNEEELLKNQISHLKNEIQTLQSTNKLISEEKQQVLLQSKEYLEQHTHSQKEIDLLKQMMMKTIQEFKEERIKEENLYQERIKELQSAALINEQNALDLTKQNEDLNQEFSSLKKLLEQAQQELMTTSQKLQNLELAHKELTQFTEELKFKMAKSEDSKKHLLDSLNQKELLLENLQLQNSQLSKSLAEAEEACQQAESEKQEHESRLRVAQQHLGKKVRESTLLSEKNEELKIKVQDLENALEVSKGKFHELHATLEAETQHQKKLQSQYQESLKAIESQAAKWEEKYFIMHEKWQEGEARNRELKRLEDRFGKLQQAMGHLGNLIAAPLPLPVIENSKALSGVDVNPPTAPCATIQASFFENSKNSPRYKESLFG